MKKTKLPAMLVAAAMVGGLSLAGASVINAQTASSTTNPMSSLVSAIATKFNLNTADVQSVVDQTMQAEHAEHESKMQQQMTTRLSDAVIAGKLTQAQADLVKAKIAELKATMEADRTANQSLTRAEMKTKMEAQRTALSEWATANNIPTEYLGFLGGKGMDGHGGHMHMFGR